MKRLLVFVALAVALASVARLGAQQANAETALRAAIETETVKGDVQAAIAMYKQIVERHKANRAVSARALLQLANAYRAQGDRQARSVFERLVRDYADQTDAADAARKFLNASARVAPAPGDRVVKAGGSVTWGDGRVSRDGRFISYTDWSYTGNLMLHDLVAGTDRAVTGNKDWSTGNAYSSTFSPDGTQIAYGWRTYGRPAHTNELRVVSAEDRGDAQPRRVHGQDDIDFYDPGDWSADNKWLAVKVTRKDRSGQLAIIGVQDGSFRALKSFGWRGPSRVFFSPDGKYVAYDLPANPDHSQRDVFVIAVDGSRETKAVDHPAHDVVMAWAPDGRLLFASDRTGAVGLWALPVVDGRPQSGPTLLKPDIGTVLSQGLTSAGALYTVKGASTESLQVAPIDLGAGRLTGPALLENFRSGRPDWTGDGKMLAYKWTGTSDIPAIMVRTVESGETRELRPSLLYINEPKWLADGRSLVTAGRDFNGRGVLVRIDAQTGRATFLDEAAAVGRVQVSPDGRRVYYGNASGGLVVRNLETGEVQKVAGFDDQRVPGVLFGNRELSPDGTLVATVRTDGQSKTSSLVISSVAGGELRSLHTVSSPDALQRFAGITWAPDSRSVVIVNTTGEKNTPKDLWLVPLDGGHARRLDIDIRTWKTGSGIRLSPDGRKIAFFNGDDAREVWALESIAPKSSRR